jgi:prepilin-type N-terminal cleavage/methylation domain-containing protein
MAISDLQSFRYQKGFTLIEMMLVLVIASMLFGVIAFNLFKAQDRSTVGTGVDTLVSDIQLQQSKAMLGATEGRASASDYGIYFEPDQYVMFHGSSYNPSESSNFEVDLPDNLEIESTTLPSNTLVFDSLSGEVANFSGSDKTITLKVSDSSDQKTITINRYGVIVDTD